MPSLRLDLNIFFLRERKSAVTLKFCTLNTGVLLRRQTQLHINSIKICEILVQKSDGFDNIQNNW